MTQSQITHHASPYAGSQVMLPTKHGKVEAIGPAFQSLLGAEIRGIPIDTDLLGTFTGELKRELSALDCAKRKCELAIEATGGDFGITSDGSFGPHSQFPFIPGDHELLYCIDRQQGFELSVAIFSEKTNYRSETVALLEQAQA